MSTLRIIQSRSFRPLRVSRFGMLLAAPLLTAGCSADVSRFDSPLFGLSESSSSSQPRPAAGLGRSGALSEQSPDAGASNGGAYFPPQTTQRGAGSLKVTSLPDSVAPATVAPVTPSPKPKPVAAAPRQQAPVAAGQTIDVQQGDTLYGLSRRYHVSVSELQTLNGLQNPTIRPGQKLVLPASARAAVARAPAAVTAAAPVAAPVAPAVAAAPASAPVADASGTYTMRPGDNLGAVAKANKVAVADLMAANGIADAKHVRAGAVLKMPGSAAAPAAPAVAQAPAVAPANPVAQAATTSGVGPKVNIVNGAGTRVAALGGGADAAAAAAPASPAAKPAGIEAASAGGGAVGAGPKFRWPVQGRVQAGFGPRADGTPNDGIDILVPLGTEVLAAEAGEVVYTGDGIPSFGNLVLLRHANGYVTAYAHNDQLLVKRGDKVRRGQAVAKAGKTGQVDQPMLHFEVRQGQTPVDPMPFMEKL